MPLLLSLPRFLLSPSAPSLPPRRCRIYSLPAQGGGGCTRGPAILWFKHDLRLDDHPGLHAASKHPAVLPLYVFDRRILSRYSNDMLELVLFALEDLREMLRQKGSNLMIRFGNAENVIGDIALQVKASNVFTEVEVEYHLRKLIDRVEETLTRTQTLDGNPQFTMWQTPFYDIKDLKELPSLYSDFERLKIPVTAPLLAPTIPSVHMELDWGPVPTLDDLKIFMNENPFKLEDTWNLIEMSTESILQKKLLESGRKVNFDIPTFKQTDMTSETKRVSASVFVTRTRNIVGGGTNTVRNGLAAYLRYLEGTARDDWQEMHDKLRNAETRDGASFFALFGPALCLGIISRRSVYAEAIKYEKERNAGFLSPFGYSTTTVSAAADAVCSMEWYWLMALKDQMSDSVAYSSQIWRWKGYLIQYKVVGNEGPAILLVHGFGAFLEHYRDNIHGISDSGNKVWALTILGFGKSEKPNVVYTEIMWAELLRDFIIDVVGEPVHLVGNSLGGYLVAIVACFWHSLVKSVTLINSAGDVIPGYGYLQFTKERQTSGAAWLGARLLLFYLRLNLRSIVKNCYPTRTGRANDWLIDEMLRASNDPGVLMVLESIFSLNLALPLNYLLEGYNEKVLIIQGMKDPITDSKIKVAMLKEYFSGILIRELDAGHCPHDEQPEEVNAIICEWISTIEDNFLAEKVCR